MSVTYSASTNTITINGEGSIGSPFFLLSGMYAADQAGGWGVVTQYDRYSYKLAAKVIITGGSYIVEDTKFVHIPLIVSAEFEKIIGVENGTLRLGFSNDESIKDSRGGVNFIVRNTVGKIYILHTLNNTDCTLNMYSCTIKNHGGNLGIIYNLNGDMWSNVLDGVYFQGGGSGVDNWNNTIVRVYRGYSNYFPNTTDKDLMTGVAYWVVVPDADHSGESVSNIYSRDSTALVNVQALMSGTGNTFSVIDMDTDNWDVNFRYWVTGNPLIYRKHTFNLTVQDEDGNALSDATVTMIDSNGDQVFSETTDSSGQISEQTVTRSYVQKTWDDNEYTSDIVKNLDNDTTDDLSPHTLTIVKNGYYTYTVEFTLDQAKTWTIQMIQEKDASNLIARSDVKSELNISDTDQDSYIDDLINAILSLWDEETGRTWLETEHTEYLNAERGQEVIILNNYPVSSTANFYIWDDPEWMWEDFTILDNTYYRLDYDLGILYVDGWMWKGNQSVKVNYTAGYTYSTFPDGIRQILVRQMCHWYHQGRHRLWDKESLDLNVGGSVSYKKLKQNYLPEFRALILKNKREHLT